MYEVLEEENTRVGYRYRDAAGVVFGAPAAARFAGTTAHDRWQLWRAAVLYAIGAVES